MGKRRGAATLAMPRAGGGRPRFFISYDSPQAERMAVTVWGSWRDTPEKLASLVNAREGEDVFISTAYSVEDSSGTPQQAVTIEHAGARSEISMTIVRVTTARAARDYGLKIGDLIAQDVSVVSHRSPEGQPSFNTGEVGRSASTGLDVLRTLSALEAFGVKQVHAYAAKGYNYNGYSTWPKLGAQGVIPSFFVAASASERFGRPITHVEQIMDLPGGAAWWRDHGVAFEAVLDLRPGGRARQALDNWRARLGRRGLASEGD